MAFPIIDTPRTEAGDQTRLTYAADFDFTTENSIHSPSKDANTLLKQIQNMRAPEVSTPRGRAPFSDRLNVPAKSEFTPLLKSAARNNLRRSFSFGKENKQMQTPAGLRAEYRGNSPALPVDSSVLADNDTASSVGEEDGDGTPIPPQVSSSSALSTPMVMQMARADGPLNSAGNLATLREQEARLDSLGKENFTLKLKIHFLEEALRKSGKDFNEAALKENTELKVDKVTLQKEVREYRKSLGQAQKSLEEYKRQLSDYIERSRNKHPDAGDRDEIERLQRLVAEREAEIESLQDKADSADHKDEQIQRLQGDIEDLEAELRDFEGKLDERNDELEALKENGLPDQTEMQQKLDEQKELLGEKEEELEDVRKALNTAQSERRRESEEHANVLKENESKLRRLEERLRSNSQHESSELQNLTKKLQDKDATIAELEAQLEEAQSAVEDCEHLEAQVRDAKLNLEAEVRKHNRAVEEKDLEIHKLEQKLQSAEGRNEESENLHDRISDLEADLREKQRQIDEKDDEMDEIERKAQEVQNELDAELQTAQDRVQQLENGQAKSLKELQELRDSENEASAGRRQALEAAQHRAQELEQRRQAAEEREHHLRSEIRTMQAKVEALENDVQDKAAEIERRQNSWESQRRSLEAQKARAEEDAEGLRKTIERLRESEGTLSGRELQLQTALQSEQERHNTSQKALQKELDSTARESEERRLALGDTQSELSKTKRDFQKSQELAASLREQVQALEDEVEVLQTSLDDDAAKAADDLVAARDECDGLRRQLRGVQQDLARAQSEYEGAKQQLDKHRNSELSPGRSPRRADRRLDDADLQLASARNETDALQASLASTRSDLETLRASLKGIESSRDSAEHQARDLRTQLQTVQRESERKLQSQVAAYEQDIVNLEQDLEDARAKQQLLTSASEKAEQTASRLRSKIQGLETQLIGARAARADQDTSADERRDLHKMLKDAKLEAEDLALQVRERDARLDAAAAAAAAAEQQVRARPERSGPPPARHAAELRGLVKQIEYLSARLRREEAFRRDLGFIKAYFQKLVAVHGRCTTADLRLVRAMGVPTDAVLAEQVERQRAAAPGRVVKRVAWRGGAGKGAGAGAAVVGAQTRSPVQETRPSLRCVALMVRASVRMAAAAEKWRSVRRDHERLLSKLQVMRRER